MTSGIEMAGPIVCGYSSYLSALITGLIVIRSLTYLQSGIINYDGVCWTSEIPGCCHRRRHTILSAFVSYRHPHPGKVKVSHIPWWNNTRDIEDRLGCQLDLDSVNLRRCPCFAILKHHH